MSNTYSFVDVSASLAGPSGTVSLGYGAAAAKEGITIMRGADRNKMTVGADGTPMNSLSADRSGQIEVRLLKIAPANAILAAMIDAQQSNSLIWGQNSIVVRQNASGDITTATKVAFKKWPNLKYAEEGDMVEWIFDCGAIGTILGTY